MPLSQAATYKPKLSKHSGLLFDFAVMRVLTQFVDIKHYACGFSEAALSSLIVHLTNSHHAMCSRCILCNNWCASVQTWNKTHACTSHVRCSYFELITACVA